MVVTVVPFMASFIRRMTDLDFFMPRKDYEKWLNYGLVIRMSIIYLSKKWQSFIDRNLLLPFMMRNNVSLIKLDLPQFCLDVLPDLLS